jgi:RNA polymerase sigma-70 factor (ECF subfamily)
MLKVFTRLSQYSSDWRFSTWVRTIAKNTALDLIRKRRKLSWSEVPDVADSEPTADQTLERQQVREMVRTALSELPPIYREVLEMHHFQDLKYREIASSLDIPIGTVMNRIFRARTKMRSALADRAA